MALVLLKSLRPKISDDATKCIYYTQMAKYFVNTPQDFNLYADSALAFFKNTDRITQYPNEYFQVMVIKGDGCLKTAKYTEALDYYYKAKRGLAAGACDDGNLSSKIGTIYYGQRNYKYAAWYWADSYEKILKCHKI